MINEIEQMIRKRINKSFMVEKLSLTRSIKVIAYDNKYYIFKYKRFNQPKINGAPLVYDIEEISAKVFYKLAQKYQPLFSEKKARNKYLTIVDTLKKVDYDLTGLNADEFVKRYKQYRMEQLIK